MEGKKSITFLSKIKMWFKKLKFLLLLWDGFWSVPIVFVIFLSFGLFGQYYSNGGFGFYDPSFWQAAILSIGIIILFNIAVLFGIWFNFRGLFKYFFGEKDENGKIKNESKKDFENLSAWQKIKVYLFVYFLLLFSLLLIVMKLI